MKNFSSWLIMILALMFWAIRLLGTTLYSIGNEFLFVPTDMTMEVALLFITFICICFFIKRKLWASIIYLAAHFLYYIPNFLAHFIQIMDGTLLVNGYMEVFLEFIGIILPLVGLFDVLLDKNRKAHPVDKKTDWFYKNSQFDRQIDERADKNNYRTL